MITVNEFPKCPECITGGGILLPISGYVAGLHQGVVVNDVSLPIEKWKCTVCKYTVK